MNLTELIAHTMKLVTLNREELSLTEIKKGTASIYVKDSHWSDIFNNVLDRIFDGFQELASWDKIPYKTMEVTKAKDTAILKIDTSLVSRVVSVFEIKKNGLTVIYAFRNLDAATLVIQNCNLTTMYIQYEPVIPRFTFEDIADTKEVDLTADYGFSNELLNWVAKYACCEIQEHIDEYKAYSNRQEVVSEISKLRDIGTPVLQDSVEETSRW